MPQACPLIPGSCTQLHPDGLAHTTGTCRSRRAEHAVSGASTLGPELYTMLMLCGRFWGWLLRASLDRAMAVSCSRHMGRRMLGSLSPVP